MGKAKKAWKQIQDEQLDDLLQENKSEGESVKTLTNDSLFFVDAKGNSGGTQDLKRRKRAAVESENDGSGSGGGSSKAQKLDESLLLSAPDASSSSQSSALVPTKMGRPIGPPSSKVARWKRRHATWVNTKASNQRDDIERKRNLQLAGMKFSAEATLDIWGEDPEKGVKAEKVRNKGFEVDTTPLESRKRVYMRPRSKQHVERAKELVDPSGTQVLPSGGSFNPDEEERQKALLEAYIRDEKERKEEAELKAKLNPNPGIVPNALPEEDDESELFPSKKLAKPKTKAQKNSKTRQIQEAFDKAKEKQQASLHKQIARLGSIASEVKNEEKKLKVRHEALEKLKEHPDHRPKTSKHAFEAPFPEVPLADELSADRSMRTLAPSFLIMRDQFKRFQEKNLIETRVRVNKQRKLLKSYTRKSHKDPNQTFPCKLNKT